MLKDKVDAIAKHGDELNRNKIDKSSIELENVDSFDIVFNLILNVDNNY